MKVTQANFWELSLDGRIRAAGWFSGTIDDWHVLAPEVRRELAFAATGCQVACATWPGPIHCVHLGCQIRRGELPKIAAINWDLRHERSDGWLRFVEDRSKLAQIFRAFRRAARETGEYDIWKLGWKTIVFSTI